MSLFKTFKAKIHGAFVITEGNQVSIDPTITFTKRKIILKDEQINRIYLDPMLVQVVTHRSEYDFDKKLNRDDERMFSIILRQRINVLDNGLHHLDINLWNRIKANFIHNRYWIDREKEWFAKTLVAGAIGCLFGLMGAYLGYKAGIQSGKQSTTVKTIEPPHKAKQ